MFLYTYLLILAVYLNRDNLHSVLLTLLVGLSWYLPVDLIQDRTLWFITCIFAELFVLTSALILKSPSKYAVAGVAAMLVVSHLLCWKFRTLPTYYIVANYLEIIEIISCSLLSKPIIIYIKERVQCLVQKF